MIKILLLLCLILSACGFKASINSKDTAEPDSKFKEITVYTSIGNVCVLTYNHGTSLGWGTLLHNDACTSQ